MPLNYYLHFLKPLNLDWTSSLDYKSRFALIIHVFILLVLFESSPRYKASFTQHLSTPSKSLHPRDLTLHLSASVMTTLFSSFSQALPDISQNMIGIQRDRGRTEGRTHISGSNTANCEPPASALGIPVSHWTEKADTLCLGRPEVQAELNKAYMPLMEQAHKINSEEDVVVASAQHFTYPVNVALNQVHPYDSVLCEVSKGKDDSGPTSSTSRVDRMYFKGPPEEPNHPGISGNTMACLEFKRLKVMNSGEFEGNIVRTIEAFNSRIEARQEGDDLHTTETQNVSTILSQATHYAIKFNTPFVALFDYQTLILLVLNQTQTVNKHRTTKGYGGNVRIFLLSPPPPASHR